MCVMCVLLRVGPPPEHPLLVLDGELAARAPPGRDAAEGVDAPLAVAARPHPRGQHQQQQQCEGQQHHEGQRARRRPEQGQDQ